MCTLHTAQTLKTTERYKNKHISHYRHLLLAFLMHWTMRLASLGRNRIPLFHDIGTHQNRSIWPYSLRE